MLLENNEALFDTAINAITTAGNVDWPEASLEVWREGPRQGVWRLISRRCTGGRACGTLHERRGLAQEHAPLALPLH